MAFGKLSSFALKSVHGLDTGNREKKGSGAYGAVYKVTVDGVPCIAKRLHDILVNPEVPRRQRVSIQQKFHDECMLLSQLRHPNVVHFVGVHYGSNQDDMSLIMECLDTDLAKCLETQPNILIQVKLSILLDVSYGLLYLHTHSPQIIHRDLTAANILLTRDKRAKLADLGVSKLLDPHTQAAMMQTKAPGTPYYMPPEALKVKPKYDEKLDIFSFGHVALYVVNQNFPEVFEVTITPDILHEGILQIAKRQMAIDEMGRDHCLYDVVTKCLQDNPTKRPTTFKLNEILNRLCMKNPREHQGMTEIEQLSDQLSEKDQQLAAIAAENDCLQEEVLCKTQQVKQYKKQVDQYKQEVGSHIDQNDHLREEVLSKMQQLKQYKKQVDLYKEEVGALKTCIQSQMQLSLHMSKEWQSRATEWRATVQMEAQKERSRTEAFERKIADLEQGKDQLQQESYHMPVPRAVTDNRASTLPAHTKQGAGLSHPHSNKSAHVDYAGDVIGASKRPPPLPPRHRSASNEAPRLPSKPHPASNEPPPLPSRPHSAPLISETPSPGIGASSISARRPSIPAASYSHTSSPYSDGGHPSNAAATRQPAIHYTEPPTVTGSYYYDHQGQIPRASTHQDAPSGYYPQQLRPHVNIRPRYFTPSETESDPATLQTNIPYNPNFQFSTTHEFESGPPAMTNIPYDPNLVCPMCNLKFRVGEIQRYRRHVQKTCTEINN